MGGYGSGCYYRIDKKATMEEQLRIDIGYLARRGYLQSCVTRRLSWSCRNKPSGAISVKGGFNMVTFSYTVTAYGGEPDRIKQIIHIEYTPCHFGGSRPWFTCPGCQSRVGVLVCAKRLFACRVCSNLPYTCQQESTLERASRRIRKIQRRLGNPDWYNVLEPWFPKPKGMHRKTYNRIVAKVDRLLRILRTEMARMGFLGL